MTDEQPITSFLDTYDPVTECKRHLLETPVTQVSDTTIAQCIFQHASSHGQLVCDREGVLWMFRNDGNGLYERIEDAEMANVIHALEMEPMQEGRFKRSATRSKPIIKVIKDLSHAYDFFNDAPHGVAVRNGFLSVHEGRIVLEPLNQTHRQRFTLNADYDPAANAAMIDNFLAEAVEDPETVDLIYELIGIAIFGHGGRLQKFIVLHAEGGNGKGVLTSLIEMLIPRQLQATLSPKAMVMEYLCYALYNKIINIVGELPKVINHESMTHLKMFTGNDPVMMRPVGGNAFSHLPKALHIFSTNKLPVIEEVNNAIRRRAVIIPFPKTVTEQDVNDNLAHELFAANGNGLLRRAVEGYQRFIDRDCKLDVPERVRFVTDQWIMQNDLIRLFVETCIEHVADHAVRISVQDMSKAFHDFCAQIGKPLALSDKMLAPRLESCGLQKVKSGGVMTWTGAQIKPYQGG